MSEGPDNATLDPWAGARHSMLRLERSAVGISLNWIVGASLLGGAVALFIVLGALLNVSRTRLGESFRWTQHGDAILLHLDGIQQSVFQGEANARAFALDSDPANIAAVDAAREHWRGDAAALRGLVSDNAMQGQRLGEIHALAEARFARLEWFVHLDDAARAAALDQHSPGNARLRAQQKRLSDTIGARLKAFRGTEIALLEQRRAVAERGTELLNYLAIGVALLAPLCAFAGFYLLFRERHRRHARELQVELIHTQRLALMGETASMLAHEVNQPLAAATNYLSALNRMINTPGAAQPEKVREASRKAGEQIARAVTIVQRLRNFIAKQDSERTIESPSLLAHDAVALFGTLGMSAQLKTHIEPGLPALLIDRVQIQQVIVNLLRNALEAMQHSEKRELDLNVIAAKDGMVQFCLRDTGTGLSRDVAEKLFRPFTSTKPGGMGVGLSICQKIITNHGGRIWAVPADGGGTLFCFTLPGAEPEAVAAAA